MVKDKEKDTDRKGATDNRVVAQENLNRLRECTRQLEEYNARMSKIIEENKNKKIY